MLIAIGDRGDGVRNVQNRLNAHGFSMKADGIFGNKTEQAVEVFQAKNRLYVDGKVGPITWAALQREPSDDIPIPNEKLKFSKVYCDKYEKGYGVTSLRSDCAEDFKKVVEEAHEHGAIVTSSGGRRALSASVGANRSKTSFHYTGLAHDLYIWGGMVDPLHDPYVLTKGSEFRKWTVWARCDIGGEVLTLKGYTYDHVEVEVTDRFINLTELFDSYGFSPISSRASFMNGGSAIGAEWWHFQYDQQLVVGESTFGEELLKVYSLPTLEKYSLWNYKNYVFGVNWW